MEFIAKNKAILIASEMLAALVLAVCIFSLRTEGSVALNSWQAVGSFISAVVFVLAFFPLCYFKWFRNSKRTLGYYLMQCFFWLLVSSFAVVLVGIGGKFVAIYNKVEDNRPSDWISVSETSFSKKSAKAAPLTPACVNGVK